VEERESREWEYNGVQRSTTERRVSRRMRMRTRMERVLGRRLIVSNRACTRSCQEIQSSYPEPVIISHGAINS
jgi:hypothetical protein